MPPPRRQPEEPGLFDAPPEPRLLTVSQLTRRIAEHLEDLGRVEVEGEISGLKRAASGHVYLDLVDSGARVSCVVWRSQVARVLKVQPREGLQVVVRGRLNVYAPRGSYSLILDALEQRGIGALLAQLEELKAELKRRGWFDRARPLPELPRRIGVVTSRDGAALRDFLKTRSARWPLYPVRLCHTPVQGPGAAVEIAAAIDALDASGVDLIVITRGGGSLEDLWAFNELPVAEAIWRAGVPVVSAVGHESDFSLSDLVADHRAHTPTDAAQTVIPERERLLRRLADARNWLGRALDELLEGYLERLERLATSRVLRDADWLLDERTRHLEQRLAHLRMAGRAALSAAERTLAGLSTRLERAGPAARFERFARRLTRAGARLESRGEMLLEGPANRLALAARSLEATSPLAVLGRGYAIVRKRGQGALLRDAAEAAPGDELETRLGQGSLLSRVFEVDP